MTLSSAERKARARLPALRVAQVYVPLPVSRWIIRLGRGLVRLGAEVRREAVSADGVPCEWLIPRYSPEDQVLLYLHGGGFVFGLTPRHMEMVARLAQKMGTRSLMVDYRLGPEHPFPAPLNDCFTAYRWLLKQGIRAQNIVVAGDSAGGNLTITMMMKLRDSREPLPAAAACLSPVADFTERKDAPGGLEDPLLPPGAIKAYNRAYVGQNDPRDPLISPAFGDWHGLPPLLVHTGEDEILREDAVRIEEMARAAGVEARLEIYPRMWHVWQINPGLPQTVQSLDDIAQFLRSYLGGPGGD